MTEIINKVVTNSVWMGAQPYVVLPNKGYIDMRLRNAHEAEVRLAQFGGFSSLIGSDKV